MFPVPGHCRFLDDYQYPPGMVRQTSCEPVEVEWVWRGKRVEGKGGMCRVGICKLSRKSFVKMKGKNCDWVSLHTPFLPHLQNALNLTNLILLLIQEGL